MSEELARQESRARFAEYVLAVIGAWAISAAQYNSAPLVFTALAAAVAYIYLDVARLRPLPSAAVQAVCGIAFVWVLVAYSGSRTVFVLGHLLIGMQAARFFGPRRMTSGHEIYLLNVTLLVVAGVHDSGVGFLARLVAFVPVILWAAHERLLETEIRNRLPAAEPGPSIGVVGRKEARTEGLKVVAAMTVVGLGLGLVLFFLTPVIAGAGGTAGGGDGDDGRGGRRGRGRPGAPAAVVGFSPQVTLYTVGRLKSDRSPALIVRLGRRGVMPRTAQGRMLMRGLTYMHYGAGSWAVPSSRGRMISAGGREVRLSRPGPDVPLALQTVTVKADFEGVVFAMRPLVSLKAPTGGISVTESGDVRTSRPMAIDEAYEAVSGARRPSDDELAEAGIAREPAYLRAGRRSKEFRELADDLKARGRTDHQRVLEVRDFLGSEGNFAYSLEFLPTPDVDPIEDFLFTQREGHCAYFASAMVLLLRQMGIPARLATGFAEGEYVPAIKAYVVRQADAHAWVEVPYNGHGWVAFDPTPIDYGWRDPRNRLGTAPLSERRGRALVGRMASAWGNWVVRYDRGKQRRLYSGLATLIGESLAWGRSRASSVATPWVGWGGAALLLGGGIIGAAWSLRRKERERLRELGASGLSRPQRSVIGFYHRMLEMLARCGVRRRRSETATEFAGRATRGGDAPKEPMVALTFAFERVRYGRLPLSESEADEADRALAELGRSLETADARGSAPP